MFKLGQILRLETFQLWFLADFVMAVVVLRKNSTILKNLNQLFKT